MSMHYNSVSVGGGLAGLTAAARAAELGALVAVIERGETVEYLCNARVSGGIFHIAYQDVKLPYDELIGAMTDFG